MLTSKKVVWILYRDIKSFYQQFKIVRYALNSILAPPTHPLTHPSGTQRRLGKQLINNAFNLKLSNKKFPAGTKFICILMEIISVKCWIKFYFFSFKNLKMKKYPVVWWHCSSHIRVLSHKNFSFFWDIWHGLCGSGIVEHNS